jgi:thymidylate synthase ThyX
MIEKYLLGKTSYGGEIYWLEAEEPWEIPALRCVMSTGKIKKEKASIENAISYFNKNPSESKGLVDRVYAQKHSSIGELSREGIYLKGVSRLFTFVGWMPIGAPRGVQGVGTEKSLRRVKAKDFVDNGEKNIKELCENAFRLYEELAKAGYELEDARYILPLATKTEEIMQIPLGRELGKWSNYLSSLYFTEAGEVGKILKDLNSEKSGLKVDELPSRENYMPLFVRDKIPQRKWLESVEGYEYTPHFDTLLMGVKGSIASFHQQVRDRQERILWPSWEEVVMNDKYVLPSPLKSRSCLIGDIYKTAQDLGEDFWKEGKIESAIFSQPLGKEIHVISTIHGRDNIIYTFMLRTCQMAQQEIRSRFREAAKEIEMKFGSRLGPRCVIEGKCYEARRKECPEYKPDFEPEIFIHKLKD